MFNWRLIEVTTTRGRAALYLAGAAVAGGAIGRYTKDGLTYFGEKAAELRWDRKVKKDNYDRKIIEAVKAELRQEAAVVAQAKPEPTPTPSVIVTG